MKSSRTILLLSCACGVLLSGCENVDAAKKAKGAPLSLQAPSSSDDRIARLEQQIADLQKEVAASRPQLAKIDVIEQKFKDLSLGLDKIDATYNMKPAAAAPAPAAPVVASPPIPAPAPQSIPAPAVSKPVAATPPAKPVAVTPPPKPVEKPAEKKAEAPAAKASGAKEVQSLRVGEQKGSTRLVLDLGQPVKVTSDVDNDEKILLIEIPGFAWKAPETRTYPSSPLIASYQATSDASGTHLVVQLKKAAKVVNAGSLAASKDKGPRAVIDIAAQ